MRIGIVGKMFAGKTTFAQTYIKSGFQRIAFADELKLVTIDAINDIMSSVARRDRCYTYLTKENIEVHKNNPHVRRMIQDVGSLGRYWIGPESIWTDLFIERIHRHPGTDFVCDDCRMPDEATTLQELDFYIIKLERNEEERIAHLRQTYGDKTDEILNHSSEKLVDTLPYDFRIESINPTQLHEAARYILENNEWHKNYASIQRNKYGPVYRGVSEVPHGPDCSSWCSCHVEESRGQRQACTT